MANSHGTGMANKGRRHWKTWFYIGREYFLSFGVAFLFFFFLFFLNQVLVMAEEIFAKKVAFWDVLKLVIYSMPVVIALLNSYAGLAGSGYIETHGLARSTDFGATWTRPTGFPRNVDVYDVVSVGGVLWAALEGGRGGGFDGVRLLNGRCGDDEADGGAVQRPRRCRGRSDHAGGYGRLRASGADQGSRARGAR